MKYGVTKESAKRWANKIIASYRETEEGKKEIAEMNKELEDFVLYGKPTTWFNNELLQEIKDFNKDNHTIKR